MESRLLVRRVRNLVSVLDVYGMRNAQPSEGVTCMPLPTLAVRKDRIFEWPSQVRHYLNAPTCNLCRELWSSDDVSEGRQLGAPMIPILYQRRWLVLSFDIS